MTLFKPTLILQRLIISRGKHIIYNEAFHKGVNIIRGENGSGKTTIVESIIYVLGGALKEKKDEFLLCDYVFAELEINGSVFTFKRPIEEEGSPALDIFEGSYEDALNSHDHWVRYPNRRTNNQKSYSEIIFNLLRLPEEKTDRGENITIHDVLRLLYEDQYTSADKIFVSQSHPEGNSKKQAISDLLLGIDDFELHDLRRQLADKEKEFSKYNGQLSQIYRILGSSEMDVSLTHIQQDTAKFVDEKEGIEGKIQELYSEDNTAAKSEAKKEYRKIQKELTSLKKTIHAYEEEQNALVFETEDSKEFIESLNIRLDALSASTEITKALGSIDFTFCPSCLQLVGEDYASHQCGLCKSDIEDENRATGYFKMQNEILFQKRESEAILERKKKKLDDIQSALKKSKATLSQLERKHINYVNSVSPIEAEVRNLIARVGYIDRAIQDNYDKEKLASKIDDISKLKASLNSEISRIKDAIKAADSLREKRRGIVYTAINDTTVALIKNDPNPELSDVERIVFDFGKEDIFAIGKTSPAASTRTYLKNAFFFSLFLISLEKSFMRYPRFIIMDNIEDSGLETERVHQFHQDVISRSDNADAVHQVIFTARSEVITEELDASELCVGQHYHREAGQYSLNIASK